MRKSEQVRSRERAERLRRIKARRKARKLRMNHARKLVARRPELRERPDKLQRLLERRGLRENEIKKLLYPRRRRYATGPRELDEHYLAILLGANSRTTAAW